LNRRIDETVAWLKQQTEADARDAKVVHSPRDWVTDGADGECVLFTTIFLLVPGKVLLDIKAESLQDFTASKTRDAYRPTIQILNDPFSF
jgi:hypothetical protein